MRTKSSSRTFIVHMFVVAAIIIPFLTTFVKSGNDDIIDRRPISESPNSNFTICNLPNPSQWIHRPIFLQADSETTYILDDKNINSTYGLPLGEPIPFESDLFKGKIMIRIANVEDNLVQTRKPAEPAWKWQYTLQGRFHKEAIPMDQLYMGEVYDQPLLGLPPPFIMKSVRKLFDLLVPGIQFYVDHPIQPKVLVLLGGTMSAMRADKPGNEPNIEKDREIEESCTIVPPMFSTASRRREILRHPKKAAKFEFDQDHVYTFHHFDNVMDYTQYKANLAPGIKVDLLPYLNGQAMSLGVMTADGRWLFRFRIWNERTVKGEAPEKCHDTCDDEVSND